MKTQVPSKNEVVRTWHVIDAEGEVLGRIAAQAAQVLMGKHKPTYTPFLDTGDHVVVVNAAKVRLTGNKEDQKLYRRHSGYPGGLTETQARKMRETRPHAMVEEAIQGMLPKTKLGKQMYRKLNVYAGDRSIRIRRRSRSNGGSLEQIRQEIESGSVGSASWERAAARRRSRECSCAPARAQITVNGRPFEHYFPTEASRAIVRQPLLATETADKFDVLILTDGGGSIGQAGAARLGIARALSSSTPNCAAS